MKTLLGYSDTLSLRAGGAIGFKVSLEAGSHFDAQIVRIVHGDTNPAGPGYREDEVDGASWHLSGRRQPVHCGSCALLPAGADGTPGGFAFEMLVWPTTPTKPDQVLASLWSARSREGFQLILDGSSGLVLRLGGATRPALSLNATMLQRRWYRVRAAFDIATGRAELSQWPLQPCFPTKEQGADTRILDLSHFALPAAPLVLAARTGETPDQFEGFFNGKLETPQLWAGPDGQTLLGAWDFSHGIPTDRLQDISGNGRHGRTWQLPTRGTTGHNWTGKIRAWTQDPSQYGAIHFHDDDLQDAGWDDDFAWQVPSDLPSGVYAARLRSKDDEDHIPFVVRPHADADARPPHAEGVAPAPGRSATSRSGRLLFIVPTASYLAYANEHMALDYAFAERVHDHVPVLGPNELHVAAHRELGNSLYDMHSDGSPVYRSSRRRPILNMRPKVQSWLGGGVGSGLWQLNADTHLLGWLAQENIPYDCVTDEDLDIEGTASLAGYGCVMTGSHPEYWSTRMRDALDGYRDTGGRIMYMGGNGLYWRIAYDPAGSGTIEVRRGENGSAPGDSFHAFSGELGGLWRRIGRPPQEAVGVGFIGQGFDVCSYYRRLPDSRDKRAAFIFDGVDDEIIGDFGLIGGGAAGIELDRADFREGTPPHALVLARSEGHSNNYLTSLDMLPINCLGTELAAPIHADLVFFETASGGAVFSTGSIAWAGSLSHDGYRNNVARITGNVLRRFLDPTLFSLKDSL